MRGSDSGPVGANGKIVHQEVEAAFYLANILPELVYILFYLVELSVHIGIEVIQPAICAAAAQQDGDEDSGEADEVNQ